MVLTWFFKISIWALALNTLRLLFKELRKRRNEKRSGITPVMQPHDFTVRDEPCDFCLPVLFMLGSAVAWTLVLIDAFEITRWLNVVLMIIFYWSWHEATDRITWNVTVKGEHMHLKYFNIDFIKKTEEQSPLAKAMRFWLMPSAVSGLVSVHDVIALTLPNGDLKLLKWNGRELVDRALLGDNLANFDVQLFKVETTHTAYELMTDYLKDHGRLDSQVTSKTGEIT